MMRLCTRKTTISGDAEYKASAERRSLHVGYRHDTYRVLVEKEKYALHNTCGRLPSDNSLNEIARRQVYRSGELTLLAYIEKKFECELTARRINSAKESGRLSASVGIKQPFSCDFIRGAS